MDCTHSAVLKRVEELSKSNNPQDLLRARQMIFSTMPASAFVERYFLDNEGKRQSFNGFPQLRIVYDNKPKKLLLKCSRKVLKSTLISNFIAMNMIRWPSYKMLYVGPQEMSTKYFSANYIKPRFDSPEIKAVLPKGLQKDDVFEKTVDETGSTVILRYVKEDASRVRGPATDENFLDEVQDISFDAIPIIRETMAVSALKREVFSGTPLTTDNTIHRLWRESTQLEWAMKCEGCNHWNTLTEDNDPMKMILAHGLSCTKCGRKINSRDGEFVQFHKPKDQIPLVGVHLAQPLMPFYNEDPEQWTEFYQKVTHRDADLRKVYNESFGLAFDVGTKPISEAELQRLCVLGSMGSRDMECLNRNKSRYVLYTMGVDWGVNAITSRTVVTLLGLTTDGKLEVVWVKVFQGLEYMTHIKHIADIANALSAYVVCDGGPDPVRGHILMDMTSAHRTQLIRYENGKLIQRSDRPSGAIDPKAWRWVLHRSDTLSKTLKMLKDGNILFPDYQDVKDYMQDILNVYIEVKELINSAEIYYRHKPDAPDDQFHSLNWQVMAALMLKGDSALHGPSSSCANLELD